MSILVKMVKIGSFWGQKWPQKSKFGENGQTNFSLKVSKNYLSRVYGYILVKNVINGGRFGQNRTFLVKMVKIRPF